MARFEFKLSGGDRATWEGATWEDAAVRLTDARRVQDLETVIVAWREADRHGIFPLARGAVIIG